MKRRKKRTHSYLTEPHSLCLRLHRERPLLVLQELLHLHLLSLALRTAMLTLLVLERLDDSLEVRSTGLTMCIGTGVLHAKSEIRGLRGKRHGERKEGFAEHEAPLATASSAEFDRLPRVV
jgi:hypothetical protein